MLRSCTILLFISYALALDCPSDWTDAGAFGCFHFATEAGGMNWFHAQQYCHDVESGAWLAEIPDDITQSLLYGFMADLPHNEWWVGGDDLWKEGTWVWERKHSPITYTHWAGSEPNNSGGRQHCLVLGNQANGFWADDECLKEKVPICQKFDP